MHYISAACKRKSKYRCLLTENHKLLQQAENIAYIQTFSELDCRKTTSVRNYIRQESIMLQHHKNLKKNQDMTQRNITRYTYETTSFQGWRLSICRKWNQFTKYFSDRQYGSEEAAFQAAIEMRDRIFDALKKTPDDPRAVFEQFKNGIADTPTQSKAGSH